VQVRGNRDKDAEEMQGLLSSVLAARLKSEGMAQCSPPSPDGKEQVEKVQQTQEKDKAMQELEDEHEEKGKRGEQVQQNTNGRHSEENHDPSPSLGKRSGKKDRPRTRDTPAASKKPKQDSSSKSSSSKSSSSKISSGISQAGGNLTYFARLRPIFTYPRALSLCLPPFVCAVFFQRCPSLM
jgi:hypothetical protein